MCGSNGFMLKAEVEGSVLTVCKNCSKYGKVISQIREETVKEKKKKQKITVERPTKSKKEIMFIITKDYAKKIKDKREQLGMKQEDFAKMLNEKESVIHHIEQGKFKPSIDLARKLEKKLKISLIETHEEDHSKIIKPSSEGFTIGDFIKIRKK